MKQHYPHVEQRITNQDFPTKIRNKISSETFGGQANLSRQPTVALHVLQWFELPWLRQECQSHPPPAPVPQNPRFGFTPEKKKCFFGVKRHEFNDPPLGPCFPLPGPWPRGVLRCDQSPAKNCNKSKNLNWFFAIWVGFSCFFWNL